MHLYYTEEKGRKREWDHVVNAVVHQFGLVTTFHALWGSLHFNNVETRQASEAHLPAAGAISGVLGESVPFPGKALSLISVVEFPTLQFEWGSLIKPLRSKAFSQYALLPSLQSTITCHSFDYNNESWMSVRDWVSPPWNVCMWCVFVLVYVHVWRLCALLSCHPFFLQAGKCLHSQL